MDRSPTEYGGPGRLRHTPSSSSNMSNFVTDRQTTPQPQILLRLQPATLRAAAGFIFYPHASSPLCGFLTTFFYPHEIFVRLPHLSENFHAGSGFS